MRNIWLAGLAFILASACKESQPPKIKNEVAFHEDDRSTRYPPAIDSLSLGNLYDKTKWTLYCIYADKALHLRNGDENLDSITFGSLPLQFDTLLVRNDTVELNFLFEYQGAVLSNHNVIKEHIIWGAVYKVGSDSIISYSNAGTARYIRHICYDYSKCPDRFVKPLQPEVVDYIRTNKAKLNPWFREEAKRRGIIQYQ